MKIPIADQYGTVWIHLLPFIRPAAVRRVFEDESDLITDVQSAVRAVISHMEIDPNERNILVAHQFVTGASDANRRISRSEVLIILMLQSLRLLIIQPWGISIVLRMWERAWCGTAERP